ncbi:MAG TPA: hypothetical protein VGG04_08410 [Candidatus Sulfotelmatobacter sp.]
MIVTFPKPKGVRDPNRPAGSLLLAQVQHLAEAEKGLPPRYQSGIFSHAIQTEGEAAHYIRAVTENIHAAHDDAAAARVRRAPRRRRVIEIAAVADQAAENRFRKKPGPKKSTGKQPAKKKKTTRGKPKS